MFIGLFAPLDELNSKWGQIVGLLLFNLSSLYPSLNCNATITMTTVWWLSIHDVSEYRKSTSGWRRRYCQNNFFHQGHNSRTSRWIKCRCILPFLPQPLKVNKGLEGLKFLPSIWSKKCSTFTQFYFFRTRTGPSSLLNPLQSPLLVVIRIRHWRHWLTLHLWILAQRLLTGTEREREGGGGWGLSPIWIPIR